MASDAVQEHLEHALTSADEGSIFFRFGLLDGVVPDGVLGGNWGDDQCWV